MSLRDRSNISSLVQNKNLKINIHHCSLKIFLHKQQLKRIKMLVLSRHVFGSFQKINKLTVVPVRSFWEYVNMMFNKPDPERIKSLGPDRACAEWVLRNGGKIVWSDGHKTIDYNTLPPEENSVPKVIEIDGSESSISHYGFPHLTGCTMLQKIILHNSKYIDDRAMRGLAYGHATLLHVQVSKCINVTDNGVKEIKSLKNLTTLVLFSLANVNNLDECKQFLHTHLPNCKILGNEDKLNG